MKDIPEMDDIRHLELLTLQTSPAIAESHYDGWVLRASGTGAGTGARRANSVTQLERGSLPLQEKVAHCEAWYRQEKQAPIFRLTTALSDPTLDGLLEQRGYTREGETHIMTAPIDAVSSVPLNGSARLVERTQEEGIHDLHRLKGSSDALARQDLKRQARWDKPQTYIAVERDGDIVCCGLARCDGDYLGVFNMRTAEKERGKGHAKKLVGALLAWGKSQGAKRAFLQVDQTNTPALKVYRSYGFAPLYDYWYRVRPQ
jgi:GNAT superfamily N-acetyltransferase